MKVITRAILTLAVMMIVSGCGGNPPGEIQSPVRMAGQHQGYDDLVALFGDPHVHTVLSDGDESPDFALRYARDVMDFDWGVVTDHAESLEEEDFVALDYYRSLPAKYDDPGNFCVLFGYEWTSNTYVHRNIYSLDSTTPMLSRMPDAYPHPDDLWGALEGYDVITVPHHPMMASTELWWHYTNPGVETSVEFYSKWGLSLHNDNDRPITPHRKPENGVFTALVQPGARYGMIAGTDTHMTRPGSRLEESRQTGALTYSQPGLTGVWATEHTREAIYYAMKNRHTYGTTGTKMILRFSVNDYIMGSEFTTSELPEIYIQAESDVPIVRVAVIKIEGVSIDEIKVWEPDTTVFEVSYVDSEFIDAAAYMVMVELGNTDMALSSPVWVNELKTGSQAPI